MPDESPDGDTTAAAGPGPSPGAAGPGPSPDEPSTADLPMRWSGSAAVPPPGPRRSRWARLRGRDSGPEATDPEDWATIPAVDPWGDHDTPHWITTEQPLPPTRIEPPPPPTRIEPPPAVRIEPPPAVRIEPRPLVRFEPPKPPKPSKTPKPAKKRRGSPAAHQPADLRRLPAPPPWAPPRPAARPLPPPPRRKRRWLRRLTLLSLFGVACCCGAPIAVWQWPALQQYPVSAVLPASFSDLRLRDDAAGRRAAERLAAELQESGAEGDPFAGVYSDARGKRVTVFGVTGWRLSPASDVAAQLDRLTTELKLTGVQSFDIGEAGAHQRCGTGRLDGTPVVVCAWADHGSLATVLLTRRSVDDSAELVAQLREEVLT